jgi:hypothetical protein
VRHNTSYSEAYSGIFFYVSRIRSQELFPTDDPVSGDLLYGRQIALKDLSRKLSNGLHQVLIGPRRTGKTSLCRAATGYLRNEEKDLYYTEVSLFKLSDAAKLAEALTARSLSNRASIHKAIITARELGKTALDIAQKSASLKLGKELGQEVEIAFTPGLVDQDPARYLATALALPQRIAQSDKKHFILFIDEFQEIASGRYGDPDSITKQMRGIFDDSPDVTVIFAGSIEHMMKELFGSNKSAFHKFGNLFIVPILDKEAWRAGLRKRFAQDNCEISEEALSRLLELGNSNPRATMLIAQQTHDISIALDKTLIDSDLIEQGYEAAIQADQMSHEAEIKHIHTLQKYAYRVVLRLANDKSHYKGLPRAGVARAIDVLRDAGIITRSEEHGWFIYDPLFQVYLQRIDADSSLLA